MPDFIKRVLGVLLVIAAQVLVLNQVHIAGYAAPMIFPLIIINWKRGASRIASLITAFVVGLVCDMFTNTPGIAAASLTLLAFIQPSLLELFIQSDNEEEIVPSYGSMGVSAYMKYALLAVLIHNAAYFILEFFTLFDLAVLGMNYGISTLLSLIIVLVVQSLRK